ncbi:MAG: helix-turn-helix domain-containing protein [Anaerolineae bacterium]|nr:helix-turn-helix domain-containing protein [Anaerolineae bacterium]MDQ7034206.1 helix-turn-helix domain-containing protein [Anaerolineae bacterium]
MPKQIDYTLNEDELKQVHHAMKASDSRVSKRATIVHSLHLGYAPQELAQMLNISLGSVYNQFKRFKVQGGAGLVDKPRSGRPFKAT